MPQFHKHQSRRRKKYQNPLILLALILLLWSIIVGWGIAVALDKPVATQAQTTLQQGRKSLDPDVPERYELAQKIYLENCASCHIGLPPAVLPTESWRTILLSPDQHYGKSLPEINRIDIKIIWQYILAYSRPHEEGQEAPTRVFQSDYFQALHPRVDLPRVVRLSECSTCHTAINKFDYRPLTQEWDTAP